MTMLMVKVNEASLHAGREDAATGKYKTRNIYSLSLSLLQNIILLFCYLVQHIPLVPALTCPSVPTTDCKLHGENDI